MSTWSRWLFDHPADVVVETQPDSAAGGPVRAVDGGGGVGELERERVRGRRARRRVLGQGVQDHLGHPGGDSLRRRGEPVEVVLPQHAQRQFRVERRLPCQQVVEHDTEGVQVGGRPQPAPRDLFGGHVHRGALECAGGRRRPLHEFRDPEVGDLEQAGGVEQHVVGFDVAVQHSPAVGVGQGCGRGQTHRAGVPRRHAAAAAGQRSPAE